MRLCLVEDTLVAGLEPLSLTRPTFELLLGSGTLGAKSLEHLTSAPGLRGGGRWSDRTWQPYRGSATRILP